MATLAEQGSNPRNAGRRSAHVEEQTAPIILTREKARAKEQVHKANIREMEERQMRGMLLEKHEVQAEARAVARQIREAMLAIPQRISAIIADHDEPFVRSRLEKEIRKALESLADEL
jgi:phage terminase Nu1 subunit (DNA packaging protein)